MTGEEKKARDITRIVVRPLGSALPIGFFAFAVGTVLLGAVELRWVSPADTLVLVFVLLAYVAPLELVAGIFALLSRDAGAAGAMAIFGAGWIAFALYFLGFGLEAKTTAMGIFMVMDSLAILSVAAASAAGKPLISVIVFFSGARFLLAACLQFGAGSAVAVAAGALGLLTGALAAYGGLALLLEDVRGRTVLPTFRRSASKQALEGSLEDQLARVDSEAGVRQQL